MDDTGASGRPFIEIIKAAVRRSVEAVAAAHPDETLAGYALLTDDGLGTLLHRAVTWEALQRSADPDLLFEQTDWPYEEGLEAFAASQAEIRERAAVVPFERHVEFSFADLEVALSELKSEGLFGPTVFLSIASTDPSEYLLSLEQAAIERLNAPHIVKSRGAFLERWRQFDPQGIDRE